MPVIFTIFLVSFFMAIFVVTIGLIIYHFAFNVGSNPKYNYNLNIEWLNGVIEAGLPVQYEQNPPPALPQ